MAIEKTLINKATYESKMDELKAALDNYSNPEAVHLNDTQTITGLKTFATLPQAGTDPSNDADFVPKKYIDDLWATRKAQEEKCYQALKTVTKDFTRTDPVYVRIGEDGEPEIHYTMTQTDGSSFFADMDLGNATLYVHNGAVLTSCSLMFNAVTAKAIYLDSIGTASETSAMFLAKDYYESTLRTIGVFDTSKVAGAWQMFQGRAGLKEVPAFDFSNVSETSAMCSNLFGATAFRATGIRVSFDLHWLPLKHDAILEVFNNLGTVDKTAGTTLTLGSAKLALMSDEEKAIATGKGWVLA